MKPIAFNYRRYEELKEAYKELLEENKQIKHDMTNLEIRCRIAEAISKNIVHCKDCKQWEDGCKNFGNGRMIHETDADDFCSYGERKEA